MIEFLTFEMFNQLNQLIIYFKFSFHRIFQQITFFYIYRRHIYCFVIVNKMKIIDEIINEIDIIKHILNFVLNFFVHRFVIE